MTSRAVVAGFVVGVGFLALRRGVLRLPVLAVPSPWRLPEDGRTHVQRPTLHTSRGGLGSCGWWPGRLCRKNLFLIGRRIRTSVLGCLFRANFARSLYKWICSDRCVRLVVAVPPGLVRTTHGRALR